MSFFFSFVLSICLFFCELVDTKVVLTAAIRFSRSLLTMTEWELLTKPTNQLNSSPQPHHKMVLQTPIPPPAPPPAPPSESKPRRT